MTEPVFHRRGPGLAVKDIAELTGASVPASGADRVISDVAAIDRAGPHDVTFADGSDAESRVLLTQAGVCFVRAKLAVAARPGTVLLVADDPYLAFVRVAAALYPDATRPSSLFDLEGKAPSALVHPSARVESAVTIDPVAVVAPGAEIGSGTVVGPMVVVGPDVRIGRDCSIEAGASLTNALIGDAVTVGPGCRIGFSGRTPSQPASDATQALGRVILQDKVIVGANSTVERGNNRDTIIGEGTVVDPLVRIPSDVVLGRNCRIMAGSGTQPPAADAMDSDGLQVGAEQLTGAHA